MYLGRVVGVGELSGGREFITYAVSGRSEGSRARKARIVEEGDVRKVNIGPLDPDKLTPEQEKMKQWIFYNGIVVSGFDDDSYVLASNGKQTDGAETIIQGQSSDSGIQVCSPSAMMLAMKVLGPEADDYSTPRIAGLISDVYPHYLFIITADGYREKEILSSNNMSFVSTYRGKKGSNEVVVPEGKVRIPMGTLDLKGKNAQELADNLYDWMDRDLVVCTAVALYDPDIKEYDLAVRNLHGD